MRLALQNFKAKSMTLSFLPAKCPSHCLGGHVSLSESCSLCLPYLPRRKAELTWLAQRLLFDLRPHLRYSLRHPQEPILLWSIKI